MDLLGWLKRVKPIRKKLFQICSHPENEVAIIIRSQQNAMFTRCRMDGTSLTKLIHVIAALMAAGKMRAAARFSRVVSETCFGEAANNPYKLMFLSYSLVAECEARFYDLNIFQTDAVDLPLKIRYSLSQQSTAGLLDMQPTIFKISDLLTLSEEFAHFSCFRQCHVNLLRNLAEILEDENVDWFDRVKSLDSSILALINDSDIALRLCKTDKQKREFQQKVRELSPATMESSDQFCFSWFNHLHFQEISVRSAAAMEVLKMDQAFKTFLENSARAKLKSMSINEAKTSSSSNLAKRTRKRLVPQSPSVVQEEQVKRVSFGNDSGVLADTDMVIIQRKTISKQMRRTSSSNTYSTDTEDLNYSSPITETGKSFSDLNAIAIKNKEYLRKERERTFNSGSSKNHRKRLPENIRRKIRLITRKMMAEGREIQKSPVPNDDALNQAFPISDDECSDSETAPKVFFRTETLETLRRKNMRKFGRLNPTSDVKQILWWHNAKDELLATRAIANHCVKITGDSSEPFAEFEEYLGKVETGGKLRDRMSESRREANCRHFDIKRDLESDDGMLLTMPAVDPFKEWKQHIRHSSEKIGLNSLLLQNMRRRCIDELLILLIIIKGQQQLQDGNVIRCAAYLMLCEYKLAVREELAKANDYLENSLDPYLMHLYKSLLAKFRLYATDLFGPNCLNFSESLLLANQPEFDLNSKCFEFCQDTNAYFFCICIRGRVIQMDRSRNQLEREDVEKQHEFFFGLDNTNKDNHLSSFWRTECMPIVSGLIHMTDHSLVESIDSMSRKDSLKILESIPGLTSQTRNWFRQVTRHGFLKQTPQEQPRTEEDPSTLIVPMLFQLSSKTIDEMATDDMVDPRDLDHVYKVTTSFVRQKYANWKEACKADKENSKKTNKDCGFSRSNNMTIFGESIEKDVYMVAVYEGEKLAEERTVIENKMTSLCRQIRSQAGFISIKKEKNVVETA